MSSSWEGLNFGLPPWKLTYRLKSDHFSREYIFQPSIFRGHVSFRGCISCYFLACPVSGFACFGSHKDARIIDLKGFSQLKQLSLRSGGSNAYDAFQFITWWHKKRVLIGTNWKGSLERVMHQNMYIAGYIYIFKYIYIYWSMYFLLGLNPHTVLLYYNQESLFENAFSVGMCIGFFD